MRSTIGLDLYGISTASNLYHDHVGISAQLGNDSGVNLHRIDGLSPIKTIPKTIIRYKDKTRYEMDLLFCTVFDLWHV